MECDKTISYPVSASSLPPAPIYFSSINSREIAIWIGNGGAPLDHNHEAKPLGAIDFPTTGAICTFGMDWLISALVSDISLKSQVHVDVMCLHSGFSPVGFSHIASFISTS